MTNKKSLNFIFSERFGWIALALIIVSVTTGALATIGSVVMIEETSTNEFCGSCHSHKPIVDSFKADKHGGNNRVGLTANCVDCHLPHDNMAHYVLAKSKAGLIDIGIEFFGNPDAIDWQSNRKNSENYVYDSGCLTCHTNLEKATEGNMRALLPHRDYFSGRTDSKCVTCHNHVGHKNLGLYLDDKKYK